MANSFNISVIPELAAVKTVVDANKVVVDLIRGTDVPGINTNIDSNETKIDANKTVVDLIRFTDFPYTNTKIDANKTVIDSILTYQLLNTTPSDSVLASADVEQNTGSATYVKVKEIFVATSGLYRITFDIRLSELTTTAFAKIYRNGLAYGIEHGNDTVDYVTKSEDLNFFSGDLIQLYYKVDTAGPQAYIRNFRIKGTNVNDQLTVILD